MVLIAVCFFPACVCEVLPENGLLGGGGAWLGRRVLGGWYLLGKKEVGGLGFGFWGFSAFCFLLRFSHVRQLFLFMFQFIFSMTEIMKSFLP